MSEKKLAVDCIIPTAGFSSRMGEWKPGLLTDGEVSLVEIAVRTAQAACQRIILVGGYRFQEIKRILTFTDQIVLLENRDYEKGMLSSIQTGLQEVRRDFFITPVDLPGIGVEHYKRLFERFDGERIIRPFYGEKPGHPILCPYSYKDRILCIKGTRLITELKKWDYKVLSWEDDSPVIDLDTPSDLKKWQQRMVNKTR